MAFAYGSELGVGSDGTGKCVPEIKNKQRARITPIATITAATTCSLVLTCARGGIMRTPRTRISLLS
jgi:hypothetical protein